MSKPLIKRYVADFETVVEDDTWNQKNTEVWAWAITELFDQDEVVSIGNTIESFFNYLTSTINKKCVYFHNLKFDGSFIIDYIMKLGFKPALQENGEFVKKDKEITNKHFTFVITDSGQWYSIKIRMNTILIEFRDSLKLLPFKVKELGKAFNTKHQKLEIDYKGHTKAGEIITKEEEDYIRNDVLVVKEALEAFIKELGYEKKIPLTIAQAALQDYKSYFKGDLFDEYYPNLAKYELDPLIYGVTNADAYIRKSYGGGWCYSDPRRFNKIVGKAQDPRYHIKIEDVNSLYPSTMHSKSGNRLPIGLPTFFKGVNEFARIPHDSYYFVRIRCNFKLKDRMLPFIQIKSSPFYRRNENLSSSFYDKFGEYNPSLRPEMTLTCTMFNMLMKAYEVTDLEILDGCYFKTEIGLFDAYINKWYELKAKAKREGNKVLYTIAKLFINSLYGKFGKNPNNIFKVPHMNSEVVVYSDEVGDDLEPIYIPIASAITSLARKFTVTAAIKNYDSFCYSDTDSIHICIKDDSEIKGIVQHPTELCCWSEDGCFDNGIYLRQKTYMEFSINEENPLMSEYDVKACGMSDRAKDLFTWNLMGLLPFKNKTIDVPVKGEIKNVKLSSDEFEFLRHKRKPKHFTFGLCVPGNLTPKIIRGGTVLVETTFTIN